MDDGANRTMERILIRMKMITTVDWLLFDCDEGDYFCGTKKEESCKGWLKRKIGDAGMNG